MFAFHTALISLGKAWIYLWEKHESTYGEIVGQIELFDHDIETSLEKGKFWIQTCSTPFMNWPSFTSCAEGGVYIYIYMQFISAYRRVTVEFYCCRVR